MILEWQGITPTIPESVFVAPNATVIGNVVLGENSSIWFQSVVRGDVNWIRIGDNTNVQDGSVLHVTSKLHPLEIGSRVTIGHMACLHGCKIEDNCLIGIGAVVLDGAVIGEGSLVGAGALVPPGKEYPPRSLIIGSPAKVAREVTEKEWTGFLDRNWRDYAGYGAEYRRLLDDKQASE